MTYSYSICLSIGVNSPFLFLQYIFYNIDVRRYISQYISGSSPTHNKYLCVREGTRHYRKTTGVLLCIYFFFG